RLKGEFQVEQSTFRGVPASSATSHFSYSNMVWRLPDLVINRPEGRLELFHQADDRTKDYYFRLHSTINVLVLGSLLPPKQQSEVDRIRFSEPPVIDGEIWGRWRDYEHLGMKARVAATNFIARGESA